MRDLRVVRAFRFLGEYWLSKGRADRAVAQWTGAAEFIASYEDDRRYPPQARLRDAAWFLGRIGEAHRSQGNPQAALEAHQEALGRLLLALPTDRSLVKDVDWTRNVIGGLYLELDQPKSALESFELALASRRVIDERESSASSMLGVALNLIHVARCKKQMERQDSLVAELDEARSLLRGIDEAEEDRCRARGREGVPHFHH